MLKQVIGVGDTEQEALENAKAQLGLDENAEYDFEVVQRAEKKVLGIFGGRQAQVKLHQRHLVVQIVYIYQYSGLATLFNGKIFNG